MSSELFGPQPPVVSAKGKVRFARPLGEYAAEYGQTDRTIKRWIQRGKEAAGGLDLPPLDVPSEMPAWWARHFKHRCPDEIHAAVTRSAPAAPRPVAPPASVPSPLSFSIGVIAGSGYEEMLGRVRAAELSASADYFSAIREDPNDPRLASLRKTWQELAKQLRELERDAGDILERSGQLVPKATTERVLAELHGAISQGIRSLWPRVKSRFRAATEREQDKIWDDEISRLLGRLNETGFAAYE